MGELEVKDKSKKQQKEKPDESKYIAENNEDSTDIEKETKSKPKKKITKDIAEKEEVRTFEKETDKPSEPKSKPEKQLSKDIVENDGDRTYFEKDTKKPSEPKSKPEKEISENDDEPKS